MTRTTRPKRTAPNHCLTGPDHATTSALIVPMVDQTWLTIDALSYTLRLPTKYIRWLTEKKFLVAIGHGPQKRWLDPTPEYKEQLRMAAVLHHRTLFIPADISELSLVTLRELAELCSWTLSYARIYMKQHPKIPRFRVNSQLHLYSITTVREILWRRQGRRYSKQRSPFLITELVDFVRREHERESADIPTDAEHAADEKIQRKLEAIVRRSDKDQEVAKNDFADKVALARKVVQLLESAKPLPEVESQELTEQPVRTCDL